MITVNNLGFKNPDSVYLPILISLIGQRYRPILIFLEYLEIMIHPPEKEPQRHQGSWILPHEQSYQVSITHPQPMVSQRTNPLFKGGIGETIRRLVTKNCNRGQLYQVEWKIEGNYLFLLPLNHGKLPTPFFWW